ncbi:hypothetical protein TUA1478L_08770 [Lactiplantibacillus plantarum]|nr:hypothetical protein [Lactiplantibacillus plantarum]WRM18131.1 hypothetical protein T1K45_04060 [Lactiplantibacillus plantarum]
METGILKQIDLTTTTERYFFVQVQRLADYVWIRSVQNFKPLELTVRVSDLQVNKHQAVADRGISNMSLTTIPGDW